MRLARAEAAPKPYVRERPFHRDPLADYDEMERKQPKRMGFVEVVRAMPWVLGEFHAQVPGEFYAVDQNVATIACPCKVDPAPAAPFNVVTRCEGEGCGRWFFFTGVKVLVYREPECQSPEVASSGASPGP